MVNVFPVVIPESNQVSFFVLSLLSTNELDAFNWFSFIGLVTVWADNPVCTTPSPVFKVTAPVLAEAVTLCAVPVIDVTPEFVPQVPVMFVWHKVPVVKGKVDA